MDPTLPEETLELGRSARQALADPGLERARQAMAGDAAARATVAEILGRLGLEDLDPGDHLQALAACHLALESGRVGNLAPVAARLAAAAAGRGGLLQPVPAEGDVVLVNHADLVPEVAGVTLDGNVLELDVEPGAPTGSRPILAPFAAPARRGAAVGDGQRWAWALHEVVESFGSLGAAQAACELACHHLKSREQFGKPLAAQQALQHRYADMLLATASLWELAHFSLWKLFDAPEQALVDALICRVQHLETVRTVFRNAHQVHAAVGFCDEHALSVASRSVRFAQYVPLAYDATIEALLGHLHLGVEGLFPITAPG